MRLTKEMKRNFMRAVMADVLSALHELGFPKDKA